MANCISGGCVPCLFIKKHQTFHNSNGIQVYSDCSRRNKTLSSYIGYRRKSNADFDRTSRIGNIPGFTEYLLSFKDVEGHITLLHFHCCSEKKLTGTVKSYNFNVNAIYFIMLLFCICRLSFFVNNMYAFDLVTNYVLSPNIKRKRKKKKSKKWGNDWIT